MKIFIYMKSRFAYDRLKKELSNHDVYQYVEQFQDIQEVLTYWNPEVAVLDQKSTFYLQAKELFYRFNIDVIDFESDFESILEDIRTYALFHDDTDKEEDKSKYIPDLSEYKDKVNQAVKPKEEQRAIEIRREIVEVEVEVERLKYASISPKLVVVGSLWSGAGSTTFSTNLAKAIAKRNVYVSYIEYPGVKPYMFDYLNVIEKEKELKFVYPDLPRELIEKGFIPPGRGWKHGGIQWIVEDTRSPSIQTWSYEHMLKLTYSIRNTPVTIVDISNRWLSNDVKDFLHHADSIYVCVDPDPVKIDWVSTIHHEKGDIQREEHNVMQLLKDIERKEKIPYEFVSLKMNPKVDKDTWEECLEKKPITYLPYIPYSDVINHVWNSTFLYDDSNYHEILERAFKPIIQEVLPKAFHYLNQEEEKRGISNIFKTFMKRKVGDT
jgi:hypothetical protein